MFLRYIPGHNLCLWDPVNRPKGAIQFLNKVELIYVLIFVFTQILGLDVCADTIVGNEMMRGISGGQKRRVTTGRLTYIWGKPSLAIVKSLISEYLI